jgi:alcohol dehydrogenase YqhD (iron-dependent ADH family)
LKDVEKNIFELGGVIPNPRLKLVQQGIDICKENHIDLILAVGGGSVIDSAKAIAVGANYDGDVWDFFEKKNTAKSALPIGVILTIPATGSESSTSCVINREEGNLKKSIRSELISPKFAILNPELTFTLPPYQTAAGIIDILAHIMERYFTNTEGVDFTDRLCEATMKSVIFNAPKVFKNPNDYDARAQIMWAGTIAHNNLLNTGRVGDWASHHIQHAMGGIYDDMAHGAGLAVIFPAWMKYVYKHDIARFVQFAVRVWDVDQDFRSPEETALEGIRRYEQFAKTIGMPTTLKELGVDSNRYLEIAKKCGKDGYFVELEIDDIVEILKLAE